MFSTISDLIIGIDSIDTIIIEVIIMSVTINIYKVFLRFEIFMPVRRWCVV